MTTSVLILSAALAGCDVTEEEALVVEDKAVQVQQPTEVSYGDLVLALTDAEEDFVSYTIDVNSILLTKENGDQIEVLPERTKVDFVEYQELTELFALVKAPVGKYASITLELDYSEAYVLIQDENGATYEAQIIDADENILATHIVELQLADSQEITIDSEKPKYLTLDLDLSSSNTIVSFDPAVVKVEAFVTADLVLDEAREHRVRGTVTSVDDELQTITLSMRPMMKQRGGFGEYEITVNDQTSFDIDGETLDINTALSVISEQNETYPLLAFGMTTYDSESGEHTYVAEQIITGTSVPWTGKDVFKGMITRLEDGISYISGLSIDTDSKQRDHLQDVALSVSDSTSYISQFNQQLDVSYLVPGQKIKSLGQLSAADTEISASFDVSDETLRILTSDVIGQVTSVEGDVVTLEVERFNKRPKHLVKKAHSRKNTANPIQGNDIRDSFTTLTLNISDSSLLSIAVNDWIKVQGYMEPVDESVDMKALKIVKFNTDSTTVNYTAHYGLEGSQPDISDDKQSMTINVAAGSHKMNYHFNPVNMMPEVTQITFVTSEIVGKYALSERGQKTQFFDSLSELIAAVELSVAEGDTVAWYGARGILNSEQTMFETKDLLVKLN